MRGKRYLLMAVVTAGLIGFASSFAAAGVLVYNNYSEDSADDTYPYAGTVVGFNVSWEYSSGNLSGHPYGAGWAMPFIVATGQDLPLQSVSMAMYKNADGAPANLTIRLIKDNGSNLPSADPADVLEVLSVDPIIAEDDTTFLNLTSTLRPILEDGQKYWVTAEVTRYDTTSAADDVLYYWIQNKQDPPSQFNYTINQFNYSFNDGAGAWQGFFNQSGLFSSPTLRVTAVPEPISLSLLGVGGLALLRRRRHAPVQS